MIKAIIFDLWETLGTKNIGISKSLQEKFQIQKTEEFMERYESSVQLKDWNSEKEMALNFLKEFGIESTDKNIEFVVNLFNQGIDNATMFGGMKDLLLELKKSYKIGFISNTTVFESVILEKWEIKDIFDATSFSWNLGIKKPTKEIFDITLEKLGIKPEEAVFIDDSEKNIIKAGEYGINTILFKSVDDLKNELSTREILI
jgi:HAD superfamily hydrolase (TIGR01509 family)